jgi:hypothetical protein
MNPSTTPPTTGTTFVVRFWREWTGVESRWRGRVEHVQSGQQASFLEIEDLLSFFERFGIGGGGPPTDRSDNNATPGMGEPRVVDSS